MGIKDFSKVFEGEDYDPKNLKNKTVAVDAMIQLHRTGRPFKTSKVSQIAVLKGKDGKATNHINGLLSIITSLHSFGANQIWVFDNIAESNVLKSAELEKRHQMRVRAKEKLDDLDDEEKLFSDSDEEEAEDVYLLKEKYTRASFNIEAYMIEDLQLILLELGIKMITAPAGIEAEAVCSYLTRIDKDNQDYCDYVLSRDFDCLLFGCPTMITVIEKKWEAYYLLKILHDNNISYFDLVKIGVILGCDFAPKTPRVGAKTVLRNFRKISLTEQQKKAYDFFISITEMRINYLSVQKIKTKESLTNLINWLVEVKGFGYERLYNRLHKAKLI